MWLVKIGSGTDEDGLLVVEELPRPQGLRRPFSTFQLHTPFQKFGWFSEEPTTVPAPEHLERLMSFESADAPPCTSYHTEYFQGNLTRLTNS